MEQNINYENVVLNGISIYNLGYSLEETKERIEKKFKLKVSLKTIRSWVKEYKDVCTYSEIRKEASVLYCPQNLIFSKSFHHRQVYKFQYHRAKIDMEEKNGNRNKASLLKRYFEWIAKEREACPENNNKVSFPHDIFNGKSGGLEQRASRAKIEGSIPFESFEDDFSKPLTEYALTLARNNYERHEKVQDFMLLNDSSTIAVEVPVYLTGDDVGHFKKKGFSLKFNNNHPVTGHIDLVQIRNGTIYILDYKPGAKKVKPFAQLVSYALGLSCRTNIKVGDFRCAWFDEKDYFEFSPLNAIQS